MDTKKPGQGDESEFSLCSFPSLTEILLTYVICRFKVYNGVIRFNTGLYCKMTTVRLVNISISCNDHLCVVKRLRFTLFFNSFQVYDTLLLILVNLLYIRCAELSSSNSWKFVPLNQYASEVVYFSLQLYQFLPYLF